MKSQNTLTFRNINLLGALTALSLVERGQSVHFDLSDANLSQKYFEMSSLFRWNMLELHRTVAELKNWNKVANAFPFLFYPQRVADMAPGRDISPRKLILIDQIQSKDRENCSLPIHFWTQTGFEAMNLEFCSKGVLNREYLIDRNRLVSILLAQCIGKGATFSHEKTTQTYIVCETHEPGKLLIELPQCNFPYNNSLRITSKWGTSTWITRASSLWILVNFHPKFAANIENQIQEQAVQLGIQFNAIHIEKIKNLSNSFARTETGVILPQLSISESIAQLSKYLKQIEKVFGTEHQTSHFFEVETRHSLARFDLLKQTMNECDRLFDLAKQTGVAYSTFQQLFYRYGTEAMDWMIEEAYVQRNQSRDAELIWNDTERLWIQNFELFNWMG